MPLGLPNWGVKDRQPKQQESRGKRAIYRTCSPSLSTRSLFAVYFCWQLDSSNGGHPPALISSVTPLGGMGYNFSVGR